MVIQESELAQVRAGLSLAPPDGGRLVGAADERGRLAREIARLTAAYPSEREAPLLLRRLHAAAEQSALTLVSFAPQAPEPVVVAGTTLRAMRWSVQLELTGRFHDFAGFLDRVDNLRQVVRMRDLTVRVTEPGSPGGVILATATAETFAMDPPDREVRVGPRPRGVTAVDAEAPLSPPPYDPSGRRDPFAPLPATAPPATLEERAAGLPGIAASELTLRGIVVAAGASLAVLESAGGRSWLVRGGERLRDGVVGRIGTDVVDIEPAGGAAPTGRQVRLVLGGASQ